MSEAKVVKTEVSFIVYDVAKADQLQIMPDETDVTDYMESQVPDHLSDTLPMGELQGIDAIEVSSSVVSPDIVPSHVDIDLSMFETGEEDNG